MQISLYIWRILIFLNFKCILSLISQVNGVKLHDILGPENSLQWN